MMKFERICKEFLDEHFNMDGDGRIAFPDKEPIDYDSAIKYLRNIFYDFCKRFNGRFYPKREDAPFYSPAEIQCIKVILHDIIFKKGEVYNFSVVFLDDKYLSVVADIFDKRRVLRYIAERVKAKSFEDFISSVPNLDRIWAFRAQDLRERCVECVRSADMVLSNYEEEVNFLASVEKLIIQSYTNDLGKGLLTYNTSSDRSFDKEMLYNVRK